MLRSLRIFCAIRRSLVLVCVCLVLNAEAKPDPDGVLCDPDSSHCGTGSAPVQPVFQSTQLRGRRSASTEEFWKRSYPYWHRRYRSGAGAGVWPSSDDVLSRYLRASVKDKGDAFWKRVDPQGFWRRAVEEPDEEEEPRKADDEHKGIGFDAGKSLERLMKDESPAAAAAPEERVVVGFPNKQRRRQEALNRPEFNPTGW